MSTPAPATVDPDDALDDAARAMDDDYDLIDPDQLDDLPEARAAIDLTYLDDADPDDAVDGEVDQ